MPCNSTEPASSATHKQKAARTAMAKKLDSICDLIENKGLDPKRFMIAFLSSPASVMATKRRYYGTKKGWNSTKNMLKSVKKVVCSHDGGRHHWNEFILEQAIDIVKREEPPRGTYPGGSYINSSKIKSDFFTDEERVSRNKALTNGMPFLYQLLRAKLGASPVIDENEEPKDFDEPDSDEEEPPDLEIANPNLDIEEMGVVDNPTAEEGHGKEPFNLTESDINQYEGVFLAKSPDPAIRKQLRMETMARTICAMVAFGVNRRNNGFQLSNSLVFVASGVTERVNKYLNYIGLTSSRKTAHLALKSLGTEAKDFIVERFSLENPNAPAPLICFDNLDFQQKVHMKSVGHTSTMFHGTWGYIHSIPPSILPNLHPAKLTTEALNCALHAASKITITPATFAPSVESTSHFEATIKSQITKVILDYVAVAIDDCVKLHTSPPSVEPLEPISPDIRMLKLMVASDNSAQGVGEVFTGLIQQSGLTPEEFHSRLQIIEGDLGSCNLVDSLRKQRAPARRVHESLDNVLAIPGAAHTLWNMAQAIFLAHWGNEKLASDTGAWRALDALGIPANKPVTKKDYNLMLSHIEKSHEATLLYFVLSVMNKTQEPLAEELRRMSSETIDHLVQETFKRFCSGSSRRSVADTDCVSHSNTLLRVRDFATIVEANRAMKAGDPGRLMYIWERWAVMGQALPKLPHYSKHLPKLILMIKTIFPKSLATLVKSTLLISPTGRAGHFVATDFFLEVQNYWLKYFYNHSGIGTDIERLKDVFSINIPTLRFLLQLLKIESGTNVLHQSHKNRLQNLDINNFIRMANDENMALRHSKSFAATKTTDTYLMGIKKIKEEFCAGTKGLDRFRPNAPGIYQLYDELEKAVSSMNIDSDPANLEVLSNHSGSEACYGDDGPEGEDEQMQRTHQITFATTQS
ncbi:hypothetical protein PSTG_07552 [Puccinia striiformis f. sp. tritici PST-78]|uniref:DUF6589 domain-containing protein n=1 Tax=Puccinia striiformis f. sp. tritici PST-78 TaxID=1165861 RepID=A0A0L0VJQ1_9BASI|nr:hypothetical protein PSTG_07552 [Puccinia striiformis f. sp. tritici PST-78]